MARNVTIKLLRATKAALDTAKGSSGLLLGEPYLITDTKQVAIGTAVNDYVPMLPHLPVGTATNSFSVDCRNSHVWYITLDSTAVAFPATNTNMPEGIPVTYIILASGAARTFTIPNTASHVTASERSIEIASGGICEVSVMLYNSVYYYQVVNGMVGGV